MNKILNIIGRRPTGGIGAFVLNYQAYMNEPDIQEDYLIFSDDKYGEFDLKAESLGSKVFVLPSFSFSHLVSIIVKLNEFFDAHDKEYTAIHIHTINIGFVCLPIAKKHGIKNRIIHSHATLYSDKPLKAIRNRLLCINLLNNATLYCACSKAAARFLYKERCSEAYIFNNAIDCNKYKFNQEKRIRIRKELQLGDSTAIVNVGRLVPQKNHVFLLSIFKEYLDLDHSARLFIIGEGPLETQIKNEAKDLGIQNNVYLLGFRNNVEDYLQGMDIMVMPSLFEGLPVIGIEAQASGLPLLVSDKITEELNLGNVTYMPLGKPAEWAQRILEICCQRNNNRESAYLNVMKKGYDIRIEARKLAQFYLSLQK